jgi:hypothetical protein
MSFGYPDNFEDARPLLQGGLVALLLMLPVVIGHSSYTGVFPHGREAITRAFARTVAVIALLYPIAGAIGGAPAAVTIGVGAGLLLLVVAGALKWEREFCRWCGSVSIVSSLILGLLFPVVS